MDGFFNWTEDTMRRISGKSALDDAIRYAVKRREALTRFCDDARLEADNNRAENCLRSVALGRKNFLFAGSDEGGERAAEIYTEWVTIALYQAEAVPPRSVEPLPLFELA